MRVDERKSAARMTRREVLKGLAALSASGWMPAAVAQGAPLAPAQFSAACIAYTGYAFDDPQVAAAMLRALDQSVGRANLARLAALAAKTPPGELDAALRAAGLAGIAEVVVMALYSGVVAGPGGLYVVTYDNALVWQACAWTKPNAFCGGATNYWANAPAGTKV